MVIIRMVIGVQLNKHLFRIFHVHKELDNSKEITHHPCPQFRELTLMLTIILKCRLRCVRYYKTMYSIFLTAFYSILTLILIHFLSRSRMIFVKTFQCPPVELKILR